MGCVDKAIGSYPHGSLIAVSAVMRLAVSTREILCESFGAAEDFHFERD